MGDWLRHNWFRLGILLAILIAAVSVAYYYILFLPGIQVREGQKYSVLKLKTGSTREILDLQEKCAKKAAEFFNLGGWSASLPGESYSYTYHYNQRLDKCFILLTGTATSQDSVSTISGLYDASDGKLYADYYKNVHRDKESSEDHPDICTILGRPCQSHEEYRNFTKKYMEGN